MVLVNSFLLLLSIPLYDYITIDGPIFLLDI